MSWPIIVFMETVSPLEKEGFDAATVELSDDTQSDQKLDPAKLCGIVSIGALFLIRLGHFCENKCERRFPLSYGVTAAVSISLGCLKK